MTHTHTHGWLWLQINTGDLVKQIRSEEMKEAGRASYFAK
jgi:hypothetical protein